MHGLGLDDILFLTALNVSVQISVVHVQTVHKMQLESNPPCKFFVVVISLYMQVKVVNLSFHLG